MFGIDLGTTYSVVARLRDGEPELIQNSFGDYLTPSVVAIDDLGKTLVGKPARERAVTDPGSAATVFKRHMGSTWTKRLGGRDRSATELSAILLSELRRDAEKQLGCDIDRVVITVPAYFNDAQRNATIEAGQAAGMQVLRVINEPTAAAIAYGLHEKDAERTAAIIDLGGGTFDVSIIDQFEGVIEVKASAGEIFLGGEDFTSTMVSRLLQRSGQSIEIAELKSPKMVARLRHECERGKRALTTCDEVEIPLPDQAGSVQQNQSGETVTRAEFIEWIDPILARISRPLRRALGDARLSPSEIDDVILVGGATRAPVVVDLVKGMFGKNPLANLPPDAVVAMGAAIQAGLIDRDSGLDELMVTDVAAFTLGIEISRDIGNQQRAGYFDPIIPRNTLLPTSRTNRVGTVEPNQQHIRVAIYQGEARRVEDNHKLGEFLVEGIPPGPPGQEVDIRFTYDLNGVLEAEATVVKTGKKHQLVLASLVKQPLSESELHSAIEAMAALKVDLRDEPENQLLLAQSERLLAELDVSSRTELDGMLTAFEHALDVRDLEATEELRKIISLFLSARDQELNWDGRSGDED